MLKTRYILDQIAREILEFWFSERVENFWFSYNESFANEIKNRFFLVMERAINGGFDEWTDIPEEILALIIMLHQFPRKIYSFSSKAYDSDMEAIELTKHAIKYKMDYKLTNKNFRMFLYMPLMHSEDLKDQIIAVEKMATIDKEMYQTALNRKNIILKFQRFPHRNKILGRKSTLEENEYLSLQSSTQIFA